MLEVWRDVIHAWLLFNRQLTAGRHAIAGAGTVHALMSRGILSEQPLLFAKIVEKVLAPNLIYGLVSNECLAPCTIREELP